VGNVDTGQRIAYDGLLRAARLAASIAGATGAEVEEIAEEALARLLLQDGPVNNPRAWVRSTATRLAAHTHDRTRLQTDDVLEDLTATERDLVLGQRAGYTVRELGAQLGRDEETTQALLAEANRKLRRSSRKLVDAGG
jgi:DNA-directed RNA polymerase specialized sigma24 family protein